MKQLEFDVTKKKRKSATGKKLGRPITTHVGARQRRDTFSPTQPLHITLRLREGLPNLRSRKGAQIIKNAIVGAGRCGVRVLHFALLSNHIHMIVESKSSSVLYNAMKSFCSRLGIHIRRWASGVIIKKLNSLGLGIFRGRYHVQIIRNPQQMKEVLRYVLLNPAKHFKRAPYLDFFTSAALFCGWDKLIGYDLPSCRQAIRLREKLKNFLSTAEVWLADVGWMRAKA